AKELLDALKAPMSLETGDVKFGLVLSELCDSLPILVDPALFRTHWEKSLTLNLKNRPRREVLETFCRAVKLDYGFFYGTLLLAEPDRLWPAPQPVFRVAPLTPEEADRAGKLIER